MNRQETIERINKIINEGADFEIALLDLLLEPDTNSNMFKHYINDTSLKLHCPNFKDVSECPVRLDVVGCIGCANLEVFQLIK